MSEPEYIPDDLMDVKPEEDMLTTISVAQAEGVKCPRCWKIHSVRCNFDNLCDRCQQALLTDHPTHESVPHIKEALKVQRWRWVLKAEVLEQALKEFPNKSKLVRAWIEEGNVYDSYAEFRLWFRNLFDWEKPVEVRTK